MKHISRRCAAGSIVLAFALPFSHAEESKDRIKELLEAIDHDDMHYGLLLDEDPFACGRWERREAFTIESDQAERRRDQIPDWIDSAIWYYIYVPAFRDGDPTNNSPDTPEWGTKRSGVWLSPKESIYGGDLDGVRDKLPYLKRLGVNALILDGVFEAYVKLDRRERLLDTLHVNDAVAVKDSRTTLVGETLEKHTWQWSESDKKFQELLKEAHRQGFRVVVEYPHPTSARTGCMGPPLYFSDYSNFIWDMNERWLRKKGENEGIDGWSVQAVYSGVRGIFSGWRGRVKSVNPDCALVGLNQIIHVDDTLRTGVHADALVYNNPAESIIKLLEENSTSQLKEFIEGSATTRMRIPECERRRFTGGSYETRFGDCLRSESVIWSGSKKEDSSEDASATFNRWQLALLLQTFCFSDYAIQFGEEIGLTQQGLPRARTPMWWEELEGSTVMEKRDRVEFLSALNALRARHLATLHGTASVLFSDDARRVFAFERKGNGDRVVVAVNLGVSFEVIELNLGSPEKSIEILSSRNADDAVKPEKQAKLGNGSRPSEEAFSKLIQRTDSNGLIKLALEPMTVQVLDLN